MIRGFLIAVLLIQILPFLSTHLLTAIRGEDEVIDTQKRLSVNIDNLREARNDLAAEKQKLAEETGLLLAGLLVSKQGEKPSKKYLKHVKVARHTARKIKSLSTRIQTYEENLAEDFTELQRALRIGTTKSSTTEHKSRGRRQNKKLIVASLPLTKQLLPE